MGSAGLNPTGKTDPMVAFSDETDDPGQEHSQDKGSPVRLSINLNSESADAFKALIERKQFTITEGIRRAITVWQFLEDEIAKGNEIAIVEPDSTVRKIVLL